MARSRWLLAGRSRSTPVTRSSAGDAAADDGQGPSHRIFVAEIFARLAFGEEQGIHAGERGPPVAAGERQIEHVEEMLVGHHHVGIGRSAVLQDDRARRPQSGRRLDLGEVAAEAGGDRIEGLLGEGRRLLGRDPLALHLIGALRIGQPGVVAQMIANEEQDREAGGEAERQPENIHERIGLVLHQGPEADRQIITPHARFLPPLSFSPCAG